MPTKKRSTAVKAKKTTSRTATKPTVSREEDALMEFEQFVSHKPSTSRRKSWLAVTLVIFIMLLGVAWFSLSNVETLEKENKFKAVYLDNGQTYYAKIVKEDALNIYLDEVYYIQMEQQYAPVEEEGDEPEIIEVPVLIQRGQELHRPEGLMQINRSKLVAAEDIGAESQILSEINRLSQ